MTGLYIHIPFCARKCRYCDFHSHPPAEGAMAQYVERLVQHIQQYDRYKLQVETVFIGGGTPSLLPMRLMDTLCRAVHAHFDLSGIREWTVEANPDSITPAWLELVRRLGVTRVSMGVQAVQLPLLRTLGRIHTPEQAAQATKWVKAAGLQLNCDLMCGLPGQSHIDWAETLATAMSWNPDHLSCYTLQLEPTTPLYMDVCNGLTLPEDDDAADMMDYAIGYLAGTLPRYEISNFAKPGYESQHNLRYWRNLDYLGLGAAAHSSMVVEGVRCRWAEPEFDDWMNMRAPPERQTIPSREEAWETLMLGLRLTEGISLDAFAGRHGIRLEEELRVDWAWLCKQGLAETAEGRWRLTQAGLAVQNPVLGRLLDGWMAAGQFAVIVREE